MKTLTLILTLTAGIFLWISAPAHATSELDFPLASNKDTSQSLPTGPVMLIPVIHLINDIIVLGDIFTNIGDMAEKAVAYSPQPGRKTIYDARWLKRVARYYNLKWSPTGPRDRIVIFRESITVKYKDIVEAVMVALGDENIAPDMLAELSNRNLTFHLPADIFPEIGVEELNYDDRTQRFSAIIVAPVNHPNSQRHRVTGKLFKMIEVPVLSQNIRPGDFISESDIQWQMIRSEKVPRDAIVLLDKLVGMSTKRGIRAGVPIKSTEIQAPVMVKKKSLLTVTLQSEFMTLSIQAKALENGAMGDVIRITNLSSKQILEAEVTGPGKAIVHIAEQIAMN